MTPADLFILRVRREANNLAALHGGPLYLCGGCLAAAEGERVRDYDVRLVIPDADFVRLFGGSPRQVGGWDGTTTREWEWNRLAENLRESRRISDAYRLRVDFQIQHEDEALTYAERTRIRLDTAPDWVLASGAREESAPHPFAGQNIGPHLFGGLPGGCAACIHCRIVLFPLGDGRMGALVPEGQIGFALGADIAARMAEMPCDASKTPPTAGVTL